MFPQLGHVFVLCCQSRMLTYQHSVAYSRFPSRFGSDWPTDRLTDEKSLRTRDDPNPCAVIFVNWNFQKPRTRRFNPYIRSQPLGIQRGRFLAGTADWQTILSFETVKSTCTTHPHSQQAYYSIKFTAFDKSISLLFTSTQGILSKSRLAYYDVVVRFIPMDIDTVEEAKADG